LDVARYDTARWEKQKGNNLRILLMILMISMFISLNSDINQIVLARVQYDGGGDWYNDPEVLPNLAEYLSQHLPINISRREKVVKFSDSDIYKYPFLFLTGHGNIVLNDFEVNNLRRYLLSGGFLYIDDDYGLDASVRQMLPRVFPDRSMVELPISHPIFSAYHTFTGGLPKIHEHDNQRPQLFAIFDDAGRIMVLYTYESNISDGWADFVTHNNPPEVRESAFRFGLNLFHYLFVEGN
jgi:hypothetical protein